MRRAVLALLASALVFGGCDDSRPDLVASQETATSTTTSTTSAQDETSPTTIARDGATATTGSPDVPGAVPDADVASPGNDRFCGLARTYVEQFTGRRGRGDARAFGDALRNARSIIQQMQDVAPPDIVDDLVRITGVLGVVVPALEAVDNDLSQVSPDVIQLLQDPEFEASTTRLQAYTETRCEPV